MYFSKSHPLFFGLATFICFNLPGNNLFAPTTVTSSAGDTSPGTLSAAIININTNSSTTPILIENATPTLTSSPFSTITSNFTIESSSSGISRTIDGNNVTAGINITSGANTTFSSDIILTDVNMALTGSASKVIFEGPNNWSGLNSLSLNQSTASFDYTAGSTSSSSQSYTGTISLTTSGTISVPSASGQTAPTLTLTGQITETTSSSLTFNNYGGDQNLTPTIILNNTGTASSWLGGTTLDNVFLNIENSSSFPSSGSITFTLGTGSILTFDLAGSDTYTGSGNIIGNNSNLIIQNGTINLSGSISDLNISLIGGTTTLSGSNAINTLNLSLNGAIGSSPTLIISSPIGSSSTLALNGGTLEIEAIVPFTSATILNGSTITVSSGEAITISSLETTVPSSNPILTLSGSGTVSIPIFDVASSSLTVDGVLGGASGLNLKQSSGTIKNQLTLTDVNTYVGETLLEDGTTLLINLGAQIGIISDNIYINSDCTLTDNGVIYVNTLTNNGTLNGSGTINGLTVENYKLIYGGNSPGTLTINGDLISYSGSTILVSITPTETSLLDVSGTVTIEPGVTLDIQPTAGCYSKFTDFVILSSDGGLTGTFSDIQIDSFLLTPQVFYGSEGALLRINRAKLRDLPIQGNVKEIAGAIDTLIDSGHSLCGIMGDFILSPLKDIENALEELQPSLFKGLTVAQENNAVKVAETINYRMNVELDSIHCHPIHSKDKTKTSNCNREKKPFHIWVTGLGNALNQSNTTFAKSFQVGYHESMGGVVLGADYHFANCLYAGVLGAYTDSDIKWNKSRGKGDIQSAYTGLYFSALGKMFYGNISVLGALSHYDAHRNIDLPSGYHKATNKHGGAQLLSHADTGVNLGWGGFTIRPFNSFDYITQTENAYTETGAGDLNLSIQKNNAIMLRNELGLNFAHCLCAKASRWIISPKISWVREVRIKGAQSTAEFTDTDASFTVTGFFPNRSLVSPGVSITGMAFNDLLTLELYYNGEFDGNYSDHSYGGQVRISF